MSSPYRVRVDQLLVSRGLVESRARAKAAIAAGGVTVNGEVVKNGSLLVEEGVELRAVEPHRFVGRGALKLDHALTLWPIKVEGQVALDVGASTGGFTEVCLERGAAKVFAVDVGSGQMHVRIASDPRVVNLEQTDARHLDAELIPEAPELVVCDVSFIGLAKALPAVLELAAPGADLVCLVKPQFEADGPQGHSKKGVVKDPEAHAAAVEGVRAWLTEAGWTVKETTASPIAGGDGNLEFLLWAVKA